MANLIVASKREVKSGAMMWHVYRSEDSVKSGEFYFSEPLKALRYAFILRKRTGAVIPKAIYNKLMAEVKASQPAPEQESKPAEVAADDAQAAAEPSPLARQYREMKAKHPDAILLFRVGDFYESFGDDAEVVADVCGLVLSRVDEFFHYEKPAYRAAFPAHALDSYLPRLVRAGKRVAICDALAEPSKPQPEKKSRKRSTKKAENK
jgi:hypothetical protein